MNRKERRAAEHQIRKQARKAGFPATPTPNTTATVDNLNIPEPGGPLPPLHSMVGATSSKSTASPAQVAANRANAQHSQGATSEAGRAASSQNRTIHGLARHNGAFLLLPTEDPTGFEALKAALVAEHQPSTETESILVNAMAQSHWLTARAQSLQHTCFDPQTGQISDPKLFSLYLRYHSTHQRAFYKALNQLLKLRSERHKREIGFEAQKRKQEAQDLKNLDAELERQDNADQNFLSNPELRDLGMRLGRASRTKGPEYDALKKQFHEKWRSAWKETHAAAA